MKKDIELKFDEIVKESFHSILKPLGYKKRKTTFYKDNGELGNLINLQKSTLFSKDNIRFTVNINVYSKKYWKAYQNECKDFPNEYECLLRNRLSSFLKTDDGWFNVNSDTESLLLIQEMRVYLLDFILPYYRGVKSENDVIQQIETGESGFLMPITKLIVYGEFNEIDKARKEFDFLYNPKDSGFHIIVEEYGKRYGLL